MLAAKAVEEATEAMEAAKAKGLPLAPSTPPASPSTEALPNGQEILSEVVVRLPTDPSSVQPTSGLTIAVW